MKERRKKKKKHFYSQRCHHEHDPNRDEHSHTVTDVIEELEVVTALITGVMRLVIASSKQKHQHNTLTPAMKTITGPITGVMETVIVSAHKTQHTPHCHGRYQSHVGSQRYGHGHDHTRGGHGKHNTYSNTSTNGMISHYSPHHGHDRGRDGLETKHT